MEIHSLTTAERVHGAVRLTAPVPVRSKKGERLAREMAAQLGRVIVHSSGGNIMAGADGRTTVSKVAAERNEKLAAARAAQAAQDALTAEQFADAEKIGAPKAKAKKIPAALNLVKGKKATRPSLIPGAPPVALSVAGTVPAGQKFCKRHNTTHSLDQFANDRSSKDGKYSICKQAEADDRAAKKARLAAAAQPAPPVAVAATPAPKAKGKRK